MNLIIANLILAAVSCLSQEDFETQNSQLSSINSFSKNTGCIKQTSDAIFDLSALQGPYLAQINNQSSSFSLFQVQFCGESSRN